MLESVYQAKVIKRLHEEFPGVFILKNDATYLQGVPDLIVLYNDRWAMLEVKPSYMAKHQVNQDYYVSLLRDMSYAAFIYPENEDEVFRDLQSAFAPRGSTRSA